MTRADFQQLAEERISDAEALLTARRFSGAYYCSGFAVECALKACIAKNTREFDFPLSPGDAKEIWNHKLSKLAELARLPLNARISVSQAFRTNWNTVVSWDNGSRYSAATDASAAQELYLSATDAADGVLPWLRTLW